MNKYLLFLFLIFSKISCSYATNLNDTIFKNLTVTHFFGDEEDGIEEMVFEQRENKIYGRISIPNTDLLLQSEVELKDSDIQMLTMFLSKATEYQNDCVEKHASSYRQYYRIKLDGKTINITRFCDWGAFTFFDIKNQIFKNYLENLVKEKKKLNKQISELVEGKWQSDCSIFKIEKGKIFTLTRLTIKRRCYLEFVRGQKLIDHFCMDSSTTYCKYIIEVKNNKTFLYITGDDNKNGDRFIYGYPYEIISVGKQEIKLRFGGY